MRYKSNIQGVCGALDGAVSPPDDQVTGPYGELDGVVSPTDELDMPKLVKLVKIGPSGELDGTPTLPDGRDTTKIVETNLALGAEDNKHSNHLRMQGGTDNGDLHVHEVTLLSTLRSVSD
nr:hypothetical protein [Tanacetum cinerariifolium]